jgi:hypothetical protein
LDGAAPNVTPDDNARFRAVKQLFDILSQRVEKGHISQIDFAGLATIIALEQFSHEQQVELSTTVSNTQSPEQGCCVTVALLEETMQIVEAFAGRIGLLPSQIQWAKTFLQRVSVLRVCCL